uniref:(northern house mosquito) hypothetical protein n=1 Tax=Culex pipiens TaxID=7175 RepID=A0A8D8N548_CULPI
MSFRFPGGEFLLVSGGEQSSKAEDEFVQHLIRSHWLGRLVRIGFANRRWNIPPDGILQQVLVLFGFLLDKSLHFVPKVIVYESPHPGTVPDHDAHEKETSQRYQQHVSALFIHLTNCVL